MILGLAPGRKGHSLVLRLSCHHVEILMLEPDVGSEV